MADGSEQAAEVLARSRFLKNGADEFSHNAWDDVYWSLEQISEAESIISNNATVLIEKDIADEYEKKSGFYWDQFYGVHSNRFFKERNWLFGEFNEVSWKSKDICLSSKSNKEATKDEVNTESRHNQHADTKFLEVGCGTGSTVMPILQGNRDPNLTVYACDISPVAVDILRNTASSEGKRCRAFVCDISAEFEPPFVLSSLDLIILVFVLSAINPSRYEEILCRFVRFLKPGGRILFRDYGRCDMAQLRFKSGRCLSENFYLRGDGTRAYFFTLEQVRQLFTNQGLCEIQCIEDRRLQVNRGRKLKMYRVWIQAKFQKPL